MNKKILFILAVSMAAVLAACGTDSQVELYGITVLKDNDDTLSQEVGDEQELMKYLDQ